MGKSAADRVREFRERQKARGLVEVRMWVRPNQVDIVKDIEECLENGDDLTAAMTPPPESVPPAPTRTLADSFSQPVPCVAIFEGKPPAELRLLMQDKGLRYKQTVRQLHIWTGTASSTDYQILHNEIVIEGHGEVIPCRSF